MKVAYIIAPYTENGSATSEVQFYHFLDHVQAYLRLLEAGWSPLSTPVMQRSAMMIRDREYFTQFNWKEICLALMTKAEMIYVLPWEIEKQGTLARWELGWAREHGKLIVFAGDDIPRGDL